MKKYILFITIGLLGLTSCMKKYYANYRLEYIETEKQLISLTKTWVITNSRYPSTYESLNFGQLEQSATARPVGWFVFKIMKTEPGSERLSINHTFRINDSLNQPITNYTHFIFDSDYKLLGMYGNFDSTNFNYKPYDYDLEDWKLKFGK